MLITQGIVIFPMAGKITLTMISTHSHKFQLSARTIGDHACAKIYQVGIVRAVPLGVADSMRIMAGVAWRPYIGLKVFFMFFK